MKKIYETPQMECVVIELEQVISTSVVINVKDESVNNDYEALGKSRDSEYGNLW